ncbi:Wee1-like protein kinase [Hondaea fermentalgiana]|uniref:Wee1-like protein kinase n=1 Tax=Hondaea fermentalgiana TaxID=2315210 RepID=A0A2R5GAR0_9STRA|nr:Wee1-like protein kinase [Hondaea fermentalgiana]|eukprot:GBG28106.1 Wee1-like protein kinase [Hondaea fermentalgiana]
MDRSSKKAALSSSASTTSSSSEMDVSSDTVPPIEVADDGPRDAAFITRAGAHLQPFTTPAFTPDSTSPTLASLGSASAVADHRIRRSQSEHRPTPEPRAFQRPGELRRKCHTVPRGHVGYTPRPPPPPTPHRMAFTIGRTLRSSTTARRDLRRMSPHTGLGSESPISPLVTDDTCIIVVPKHALPATASQQTKRSCQQLPGSASATVSSSRVPQLRFLRNIGAGNFASVSLVEEVFDDAEEDQDKNQDQDQDREVTDAAPKAQQRSRRRPGHRTNLYALKENLDPFESEQTKSYKQMLRSTRAWADLPPHENVVSIVCAWQSQGRIKIQMEFCQGGNLLDYTEACMQSSVIEWGETQVWRAMGDALGGLAHIHAHGLCHNDIKPGNLFLGGQPLRLMLGDFGHLRRPNDDEADGEEGDERYIPREALSGDFSFAGDIFMLGISFFEVVADVELPTTGAWHNLREGKIPPLPQGYSDELHATLRRMMHPDPSKRPTAEGLLSHAPIVAAKTSALPEVDFFQTSPLASSPSWSPQHGNRVESEGGEDRGMRTPEQTISPVPMFAGSPLNTPGPSARMAGRSASTVSRVTIMPGRVNFSPMVDSTPSRDSPLAEGEEGGPRDSSSLSVFAPVASGDSGNQSTFGGTPDASRKPSASSYKGNSFESPVTPEYPGLRSQRTTRRAWSRATSRRFAENCESNQDGGECTSTAASSTRKTRSGSKNVFNDDAGPDDDDDGRSSPRKCLLDDFEGMDFQ